MKTLVVGLGQLGLGLIVPVFKKAGYAIIGTDASKDRLKTLHNGYFLKTPNGITKVSVDVVSLDDVPSTLDMIVTAVGRQHLEHVATWFRKNQFSVPVLLAENLPDPVNHFPWQIPIVVDRICPRIETHDGLLTAVAEDYYKIVVLDHTVTHQLGTVADVELIETTKKVERKRKQKMFTVNTSHVLTALFGQQLGCSFIDEAIARPEITTKIRKAMIEVAPWLGLNHQETETRTNEIIARFGIPIQDSLSRILGSVNRQSARRYIDVPLSGIRLMGTQAPILKEAQKLLKS